MTTDWSGFTNFFDFIATAAKSFANYINNLIDYFSKTFGYMSSCFDWFKSLNTHFASYEMFQLMIYLSMFFLLLKFVRWGK